MNTDQNKSERVKQLEEENYKLQQHIDDLVLENGTLENSFNKLKENIIQELRKNIYIGNIGVCCAIDVNEIIKKIKKMNR